MKKTGLGKGLDALFSDNLLSQEGDVQENSSERIHKIKVIEIEPNRDQPRKKFDEEALDELANSIKTYGVLQPIIVNKKDDYYEIVAGERRWRAAKKAGLEEMPCIIKDDITEKSNKEIALIENLQRVDLNPIDKAKGLKELIDDYGMTQKELADSIGITIDLQFNEQLKGISRMDSLERILENYRTRCTSCDSLDSFLRKHKVCKCFCRAGCIFDSRTFCSYF